MKPVRPSTAAFPCDTGRIGKGLMAEQLFHDWPRLRRWEWGGERNSTAPKFVFNATLSQSTAKIFFMKKWSGEILVFIIVSLK